jgi:sterol desaturase/sphingolipid hydroxylase (fatty acid hydroxylase superfamily)
MDIEGVGILKWALPVLFLLSAIEVLYMRRMRVGSFDWRESAGSVFIAIGQQLTKVLTVVVWGGAIAWVWSQRWFTVPLNTWWSIALLFLGVEFCYYWYHRAGHEVRWFWASHVVHHTPNHLNLTAAYRLGWTSGATGIPLFFMPLFLLGFHPAAVFAMLGVTLLYQFWLHTELVPQLRWFDKIFNSPSNHRVHHAANLRYLDANYGGILIVYDRLFGSYIPEQKSEACRYGLVKPVTFHNPVRIVFHEWIALLRDLKTARSVRDVFGYLFAPPGWRADGNGSTTADMRRNAQMHLPETAVNRAATLAFTKKQIAAKQ